jgi:hypothetical protein
MEEMGKDVTKDMLMGTTRQGSPVVDGFSDVIEGKP